MKSIATKVDNTSTLPANAFNSIADELENLVTQSGQTLDATPETAIDPSPVQISRAVTQAALSASAYTDSGVADAYVLTSVGGWQQPTGYVSGSSYRFVALNTNTGASTVNISGIGVKPIERENGSALVAGDIVAGRAYDLRYESTGDQFYVKVAMVNPMTALGDIIVGAVSGTPDRLAVGASGTVLKGGSSPSYSAIVNADVSASAAIVGSKLTADTAIVSGSGTFPGAGTQNIGNFTNVTSFSLTPGRWLITFSNTFGGATGPTAGLKEAVISNTSGTGTSDHVLMRNRKVLSVNGVQTFDPVIDVTYIVDIASTTTYYLKIKDSGGTTHVGSYGYTATRLVG